MKHALKITLVLFSLVAIGAQCARSVQREVKKESPVKLPQEVQAAFALNPAQGGSELSGHVQYGNGAAAKGVVLSIGNFSVTSDGSGYYKIGYLNPGMKTVWVTPPGKQAKSFQVQVGASGTQRNFVVDW
jgi:hypothetical protein